MHASSTSIFTMPDLSGFLFSLILFAAGVAVLTGGLVLALKLLRGGEKPAFRIT